MSISTRRFLARPSSVLLLAIELALAHALRHVFIAVSTLRDQTGFHGKVSFGFQLRLSNTATGRNIPASATAA